MFFRNHVDLNNKYILGIKTNLKINARDRYIFKMLSLTALKQVTRLWKQAKSPDLQAWYKTIEQTLEMEKLTLNSQKSNRKGE